MLISGVMANLLLIWFGALIGPASALRFTGFRVPNFALQGSDVELDCGFTVARNVKMYSVKWYQNQEEIYGYIYGEGMPVKTYNYPGINVDVSS